MNQGDTIEAYVSFETDGSVQPQSGTTQVYWEVQNPENLDLVIEGDYLHAYWNYTNEASTRVNGFNLHISDAGVYHSI